MAHKSSGKDTMKRRQPGDARTESNMGKKAGNGSSAMGAASRAGSPVTKAKGHGASDGRGSSGMTNTGPVSSYDEE